MKYQFLLMLVFVNGWYWFHMLNEMKTFVVELEMNALFFSNKQHSLIRAGPLQNQIKINTALQYVPAYNKRNT